MQEQRQRLDGLLALWHPKPFNSRQVQEQRQRFEEAALAFAERTADERVAYRGLLQAKKEKAEELARPGWV